MRAEIAESLRETGGSAEDADGPFGTELRARIPVEGGTPQPARFIGVDGPRWFLRGLLTGPASTDPAQAERLEQAFRGVVGATAVAKRWRHATCCRCGSRATRPPRPTAGRR